MYIKNVLVFNFNHDLQVDETLNSKENIIKDSDDANFVADTQGFDTSDIGGNTAGVYNIVVNGSELYVSGRFNKYTNTAGSTELKYNL